jgi:hypothetical protein
MLADSWPADGPKTVWEIPVGRGFSGVAVAGNNAVLFHREGNEELVQLLDATTGNKGWKFASPTTFVASIVSDDGPRSVPVIHGDKVNGAQKALSGVSGAKIWSRHHFSGAKVISGGQPDRRGQGDRQRGGACWPPESSHSLSTRANGLEATNEAASYSSPVAVTVGGVRHLIVITRMRAVSLDPATGAVRFQVPFGLRGPTVNAASPTVIEDRLFLTANYGLGAVYGRIGPNALETFWSSDDVLSSQYTTCVYERLLFELWPAGRWHARCDALIRAET